MAKIKIKRKQVIKPKMISRSRFVTKEPKKVPYEPYPHIKVKRKKVKISSKKKILEARKRKRQAKALERQREQMEKFYNSGKSGQNIEKESAKKGSRMVKKDKLFKMWS